jgi:hypothetical protein
VLVTAPASSLSSSVPGAAIRWTAALAAGVCGLVVAALNGAHLQAVIGRALAGEGFAGQAQFEYNFHFYALLLTGAAMALPGALCVWAAFGLARGRRSSWRVACWSSLVILLVAAPLYPLGGFAPLMAWLGTASFAVLVALGKRFRAG